MHRRTAGVIHVFDRPYTAGPNTALEEVGGVPLIVRTLDRLKQGCPWLNTLEVLGHTENAQVEDVVKKSGYGFFASAANGLIGGLEDWLSQSGDRDAVIIWPETSAYPDCLTAERMVQTLFDSGSDCIVAAQAPYGLLPLVIRTSCLPHLRQLFEHRRPVHGRSDSISTLQKFLSDSQIHNQLKVLAFSHSDTHDGADETLPLHVLVHDCHTREAAEIVLQSHSNHYDASAARAFRQALEAARHKILPFKQMPDRKRLGRLRVLFAAGMQTFTASDLCLLALMKGLDPDRFEPLLAVESPRMLAERARAQGIPVEIAECRSGALSPYNLQYWAELLTAYDIDLVHVDVLANEALMTTAFQQGVPIVMHARAIASLPLSPVLDCASVLLAPSERIARSYRLAGYNSRKVVRVYDGVDLQSFSPAAKDRCQAKAMLGLSEETLAVCMVTRIAKDKRQDVAVRAIRRMRERGLDAALLLVGDVEYGERAFAAELDGLIESWGLGMSVRRLGFLNDPREAYAAADVNVVCMEREGLGQCILEAAAMGVPSIVPHGPLGPAEVIRDGQEGFHYTAGDDNELSCLLAQLREPGVWVSLSRAAIQRARAFELSGHLANMARQYEKLATTFPPRPTLKKAQKQVTA